MPLCLAAAASPIRRRWLALVELLAPSVARAGASGAHSARRVRSPPGQAKLGAGGGSAGGARMPPLVLVLVVLMRRRSPSTPTSMAGIGLPWPPPYFKTHILDVS